MSLQWRHNGRDGVSDLLRLDSLLNRLFRYRSKKTSKLRVTGLCEGNSPVFGEFLAQRASNAANVSIWWRHHGIIWRCFSQDKYLHYTPCEYVDIAKIIGSRNSVGDACDERGKRQHIQDAMTQLDARMRSLETSVERLVQLQLGVKQ